jgi:hypothetical protein
VECVKSRDRSCEGRATLAYFQSGTKIEGRVLETAKIAFQVRDIDLDGSTTRLMDRARLNVPHSRDMPDKQAPRAVAPGLRVLAANPTIHYLSIVSTTSSNLPLSANPSLHPSYARQRSIQYNPPSQVHPYRKPTTALAYTNAQPPHPSHKFKPAYSPPAPLSGCSRGASALPATTGSLVLAGRKRWRSG